ncbi:MAG: glycosyltransferase [Bacteroidetes bacterium]|nr:glycosyltransferase [Bacteroidota bacterium]
MFDVIVPIYRISEEFLLRALDSIKAQTFQEYEVYVCDGTPIQHQDYDANALVKSYGFNYLRQDPSHPLVGGARNQAVSVGSNLYLAFLDGDDYWYDGYLLEMKNAIEESISKVAIWSVALDCEYPIISQMTGEKSMMKGIYGYWEDQSFLNNNPDYAYYWFFGHPPTPTGTIIQREAFESVGGYDESMGMAEDTELILRIVGDPRSIPASQRRQYIPLPLIGGFHYIGEENTCSLGTQSGVSSERSSADINAFFISNSDYFTRIHPRPARKDLPNGTSELFIETLNGVMRDRIMNI